MLLFPPEPLMFLSDGDKTFGKKKYREIEIWLRLMTDVFNR